MCRNIIFIRLFFNHVSVRANHIINPIIQFIDLLLYIVIHPFKVSHAISMINKADLWYNLIFLMIIENELFQKSGTVLKGGKINVELENSVMCKCRCSINHCL